MLSLTCTTHAIHTQQRERWYVFQTKPSLEFLAVDQLLRQKYEVYLPWIMVDRKRLGIVIGQIKRALFPSYGFVRFDVEQDHWKPICSTYGIRRLFSITPENPIPVPKGVVEGIRESMVMIPSDSSEHEQTLAINTKMTVLNGPFAGLSGFCQWHDRSRVVLLMQILNGDVRVSFNRDNLVRSE